MRVTFGIFLSWWLLALASCGDTRPAAIGGSCEDGAKCDCTDALPGQAVCDVDTHAFVMCDCPSSSKHVQEDTDAGADRAGSSAAGSGGVRAHAGPMAAADGGGSGAAGRRSGAAGQGADGGQDNGNQDGDGVAGEGAAGHPGKALGNGKAKGPKH